MGSAINKKQRAKAQEVQYEPRQRLGKRARADDKAGVLNLPIFVDLRDRPVILLGDGEAADAKRRLLERAGARPVGEDASAALAIVAIEDEQEAIAAVARLKARGILVNAVDRKALCDFTLPAIVDRDPVLVAVGTGGASAGLAKELRQRLEALLPSDLGRLAEALDAARAAILARWPEPADRRRALDGALAAGRALDPMGGSRDVSAWLEGDHQRETEQMITLRFASPDPDDLTLRQARLLSRADRLYHRPDVPAAILDRARADARRIACSSAPAGPGPGLSLDLSMELA